MNKLEVIVNSLNDYYVFIDGFMINNLNKFGIIFKKQDIWPNLIIKSNNFRLVRSGHMKIVKNPVMLLIENIQESQPVFTVYINDKRVPIEGFEFISSKKNKNLKISVSAEDFQKYLDNKNPFPSFVNLAVNMKPAKVHFNKLT